MLCYTGFVRRNVGLIDTQIDLYREGREDTILGMKQLQEIAYAMRTVVEEGDVDELGAMLHDAFVAKRRMNPHIAEHTPIEAMLSMAQAAGANGGKICGAGGGGYLLLYCRPSAQPAVREELERLGAQFAPFAFRAEGVRAFRGDEVWAPTREPNGEPTEEPRLTMDVEATTEQARRYLRATADTVRGVEEECLDEVVSAATLLVTSLRRGGKLLICGNGGSAADAQHLATEFVSTFTIDNLRPSIPAIALTTDTSLLTAIANDFGAEGVFERQVEALGREGDVLIAISTSGNSVERDPRGRTRPCARAPGGSADGRVGRRSRGTGRCGRSRPQHRHGAHPGMSPGGGATPGLGRRGCAVPSFRTSTRNYRVSTPETGGLAMAKSKDRGAGTGGRDQKKKPQKTIKEKRAAKKTKGSSGS